MKELTPLPPQPRFECDFCGRIYGSKRCLKHEDICYKNPNRHCRVCSDTGVKTSVRFISASHFEPGEEEICDACEIAEKCGGKSYILKVSIEKAENRTLEETLETIDEIDKKTNK